MGNSWRILTTASLLVPENMAEPGNGVVALGIVDIVGSGNWLNELGDRRYGVLLDQMKDHWADAILQRGGRFVSDTGDGCIFVHESVDRVIDISLAMHAALDSLPRSERIETRHGVHRGSTVETRYGLCGAGIYETVDLGDVAEGGHLWISAIATAHAEHPVRGVRRCVELPRSGRVLIDDVDLRPPLQLISQEPVLTAAV